MPALNSRSPTFFSFFVAAIFHSMVAICTICAICHGAPAPQGTCQISNFQLPDNKPESHVVITPLRSMALNALTISITVKLKEATEYPVVVSYAVGRSYDQFSLELPGSATEEAGYYIYVGGDYFGKEHSAFPLNVWTNVTATWNGVTGEYAMYVNGEPVVPPTQNDDFKQTLRSGGKFVLGQKQKRGGFEISSRFIGSIVNLEMWPVAFNADQVHSLQQGTFSDDVAQILDNPPTFTIELLDGAGCDAECGPGKHVRIHNGNHIECDDCPPGEFSTELGSTSCTACPPGKYSASAGSDLCASCSVGEFQKNRGQTSCQKCPPGEYSLIPGSKICSECPVNLPAIEDASYVQCLNGLLLKTNAKIANANAKIASLEERHCESGEVNSAGSMGSWMEVKVTFRSAFVKTPTVMMSPRYLLGSDGNYKGIAYWLYPKEITKSGFTAMFYIYSGRNSAGLNANWMACSS